MNIRTFKLEEYLVSYEFSAPYLLCCSDAESFSQKEVLEMASKDHLSLWENLKLGYTEVKDFHFYANKLQLHFIPV